MLEDVMHKIRLQTELGEVTEAYILPYATGYPPAVVWGVRFFLLDSVDQSEPIVYRETFCPSAFTKQELDLHQ